MALKIEDFRRNAENVGLELLSCSHEFPLSFNRKGISTITLRCVKCKREDTYSAQGWNRTRARCKTCYPSELQKNRTLKSVRSKKIVIPQKAKDFAACKSFEELKEWGMKTDSTYVAWIIEKKENPPKEGSGEWHHIIPVKNGGPR